jgi:hypothetical protein
VNHRRAALITAATIAAAVWGRHRMAAWGTTPAERMGPMPGDDLVDTPLIQVTRAVGIAAPAEEVWPWIAQIGSQELGRAGWYSYDRFDNGGVPSARELLPDVGEPAVGDTLVADPDFAWTVRAVDPGHALVLDLRPPGKVDMYVSFTLAVESDGAHRCRLVERSRWDMRPRWVGVPLSLAFEPIDFVMMRQHLLGVRARAEGTLGPTG